MAEWDGRGEMRRDEVSKEAEAVVHGCCQDKDLLYCMNAASLLERTAFMVLSVSFFTPHVFFFFLSPTNVFISPLKLLSVLSLSICGYWITPWKLFLRCSKRCLWINFPEILWPYVWALPRLYQRCREEFVECLARGKSFDQNHSAHLDAYYAVWESTAWLN